jgi:hypothetical protein
MKNYIIKNHLIIILIVLILICTKIILNSVDYQTWRICQGLNIVFSKTLSSEISNEFFTQACSRNKVIDYLGRTPNSGKLN